MARTLEEAHTISVSEKGLLRQVKARVRKHSPSATVLLYGSVARGSSGAESDYDILVLVAEPLTGEQEDVMRQAVYELELDREIIISMVFCTREQWDRPVVRVSPFRREVERDAITL